MLTEANQTNLNLRSIALRRARGDDEEFLEQLYRSTRIEEVQSWGWNDQQADAFLSMQYQAQWIAYLDQYPEAEHQIILMAGLPIGRLLVARSQKEIRLVDISIWPACRNTGIGTLLIKRLQQESAKGASSLVLHVLPTNKALQLYARLGFVKVEMQGPYVQMIWIKPSP